MVEIVTLKEINKCIINQLVEGFKYTPYKIDINPKIVNSEILTDNVIISSTSIYEKIHRPAFYIDFDNNITSKNNLCEENRSLNARFFYFAKNKDNSKLELMDIQDLLSQIFQDNLKITDKFAIPIVNCEFDVIKEQGYMTMDIDLYISFNIEETGEEIETLDFIIKN